VQRFVHEILALLAEEPRIVVRVHPDMVPEVARVVANLAPERREAVVVEGHDGLPHGDARVGWRHGVAVRDAPGTWARVMDVLGPLGLAPRDVTVAAERRMAPVA
jgi:flagellar assembly protein FliH